MELEAPIGGARKNCHGTKAVIGPTERGVGAKNSEFWIQFRIVFIKIVIYLEKQN